MKKYQKIAIVAAVFACLSLSGGSMSYANELVENTELQSAGIDTVISMTPLFPDGTGVDAPGSISNPYVVASVDDLTMLASLASESTLEDKYFIQANDIIVNADDVFTEINGTLVLTPGKKVKYSTPIAPYSSLPFKGHYDGNGYSIRGLVLSDAVGVAGLFGCVENADIHDVNIERSILYVHTAAGGIAAKAMGNTVISGCSFEGTVTALSKSGIIGSQTGGVVGAVSKDARVEKCANRALFSVTDVPGVVYVGGIAGNNAGMVAQCVNYGDFDVCSGSLIVAAGGIVGDNGGRVEGCFNYGSIRAQVTNSVALMYAGGIIGENSGTTERTQNKGLITALNYETYPCYAGGIVGYGVGGVVKSSDNRGSVSGQSSYVGGIAGVLLADQNSVSMENCLNSGAVTDATGAAGGLVGWLGASNDAASELALRAALSLDAAQNSKAAIGTQSVGENASLSMSSLYALKKSQTGVTTKSESELETATALTGLNEAAWVYPNDGFYPALTVVKDLQKAEVVGLWVHAQEMKVAFAVYNPDASINADAVVAFYKDGRLLGSKNVSMSMNKGYSVYTAESDYAMTADEIRVAAFGSLVTLSPVAEMANFN